jgi:uncharacterized membrane protein SpoIIM required for sporulation
MIPDQRQEPVFATAASTASPPISTHARVQSATIRTVTSDLKSAQFRREREPGWHELEALLERLDKSGPAALSSAELTRLPILYRGALSSLSVARNVSLDRNLVDYLDSLATRAYFRVYGPKAALAAVLADFFGWQLPQAIRHLWRHIALAAFLLILGALCGYWLTIANQDWFYTLMSADIADARTPAASTEALRQSLYEPPPLGRDWLAVFGSSLFYHNSKIALLCFTLGFAFGIPTFLLTLTNGLMLGSFIALYASRGLGVDVLGWLAIHGTTELSALIIASGAGFVLAEALIFPGALSRRDNLAQRGRLAGMVATGAVVMLLVAGALEGIGRQLITNTDQRFAIGAAAFCFWLLYFTFAGRGRHQHGDL